MKVSAFLAAIFLVTPFVAADTVLLEFTADWCGYCREMAPILAGLEREGFHVERVNFDKSRARATQFNVRELPTFIALTDGRETGRLVGAVTADKLKRILGPVDSNKVALSKPQPKSAPSGEAVASASLPKSGSLSGRELIHRSVRIVVDEAKSRSFGTGTVIRSVPGETIVLTCGHLFEGVSPKAKTTVEFFGLTDSPRLPAELVARDAEADLSLIRISTNQVFPTAPVASRKFVPAPGNAANSVGCDNGQNPTVRNMRITAVNRYLGAPTIECTGQPVQGRSGGGLFNESGEVIGVCSAAEPTEHRGIYGGLAAVHKLLDRQGLASLYDRKAASDSRIVSAGLEKKSAGKALMLPSPEELGLKVNTDLPAPEGIDAAEVVMVIRSVSDPKAPAKVVVLNRASPEFLSQLEKEQLAQGSRANTAMRMPNRTDVRPAGTDQHPVTDFAKPTTEGIVWKPAASPIGRTGSNSLAREAKASPIQESAKWQKDWPPGAASFDAPLRR